MLIYAVSQQTVFPEDPVELCLTSLTCFFHMTIGKQIVQGELFMNERQPKFTGT